MVGRVYNETAVCEESGKCDFCEKEIAAGEEHAKIGEEQREEHLFDQDEFLEFFKIHIPSFFLQPGF